MYVRLTVDLTLPVEGQIVTNWKQALAQLAIVYPERINPHL